MSQPVTTSLFRPEALHNFMVRVFEALNVPHQDAETAADVLISADLRGIDSHGIIRLHSYYGSRIQRGLLNPITTITTLRETPTTLALDAGNGLGQVASKYAMQRCIEKAKISGMAFCTVKNSNHYGIAGYYAMMALEHDMIGMSFTNSQPLVAPTYSRAAMLGTNPIAVAVPCATERPFVLDMATSIVPIGRVNVYQKAHKEMPNGWCVDGQGNVTSDPNQVLEGRGALMPLGGTDIFRGYKGYGLAMFVDIFSGVLSGSAFGSHVAHPHSNELQDCGHFFGAIRIDAFRDVAEFKRDMDSLVQEMRNAPRAEGQDRIYIAGEKEYERAEQNRANGIPLLSTVVEQLVNVGNQTGVSFTELCPPVATSDHIESH